ncbi:MAG: GH3 auxin-responsive promoter family protein [Opitutaceae bacterium]
MEHHLYEPGRDIAQLGDWPAKLRAIVTRTAGRNVTLVAGIPSWLLVLAEEMAAQTGQRPLRAVWPRLECLVHGGVPLGPFEKELRAAVGEGVNFHEVYPASEGFIAAQDDEPGAGLRLMADAGIFYEFIPLARFDEARLAALDGEAVPLADVRPGIDYVLLMTTPGGLCRYVIGDVVRFVSTEPPRLVYAGRTQLQLSAFGEHVIEKELTDALTAVVARNQLAVANFHVAPRFVDTQTGETRGRHEWWIEFRPEGEPKPAMLAAELDAELQRRNDDYEAKRKGGGLEIPVLRIVAPGTFERWLRERGKWGGQNKMPRCRSDRAIADDLAAGAR